MSGFAIAVSATLYVLQAVSPGGGVQQLSAPLRSDQCYHAKQAQERNTPRHSHTQFSCVPVRVAAEVNSRPAPRGYYGPQYHPQPYVHPQDRTLRPSPYYRGAPLVDRSYETNQRWYESWQNGRTGCVTPRQCL